MKISNAKPPLHKRKTPLLKTFWRRSCAQPLLLTNLAIVLFSPCREPFPLHSQALLLHLPVGVATLTPCSPIVHKDVVVTSQEIKQAPLLDKDCRIARARMFFKRFCNDL